MEKNKNKKQSTVKQQRSGVKQQNKKGDPFERKHDPVANQGSGSASAQEQRSREQEEKSRPSGEWKRPLTTNQDEQRTPTNEGESSDTPVTEDEKEGDSNLKKIEPYKNIGDDSEEVEQKTPVN